MTRDEFEAARRAGKLPVIQVAPAETDRDDEWLCTIAGPPAAVRLMLEDMQTTAGSRWEMGSDDFAYCLVDGEFSDITSEIEMDGFQWEEGG